MTSSILVGLLLFVIALGALWVIMASIGRGVIAAFPNIRVGSLARKWRLLRLSKAIERIEKSMDANDFTGAQKAIEGAFILETPPRFPQDYREIAQHNFAVLAKAVALLDATNARFKHLDVLEEGFQTRAALLRLYAQALKEPEGSERKGYSIDAVVAQMRTNGNALTREIQALVLCYRSSSPSSDVTYH